jgi:hypothetical protein
MGTGSSGSDPGRRCELTVRGPIAGSVVAAMRARFDVESASASGHTILTVDRADQAAVRALMIMLWDSGHEVLAMSTAPGAP